MDSRARLASVECKRPVCAPDLRAGQPPLQSLSPSGTHPIAQPSDQFRQVEQLTLLGGLQIPQCWLAGCGLAAGWLAAGVWLACFQKQGPSPPVSPPARWPLESWPSARRESPRVIARWLPTGCPRPLPPPGDHRKSTAGAENPPVSLDPPRPLSLYGVLHSSPPTRQPTPPPSDLHRERDRVPSQPCPRSPDINRRAPSELPRASTCRLESSPSSTLGRASAANIGRRQPHPRSDRTTPSPPAASPQTAPSGPSLARLE